MKILTSWLEDYIKIDKTPDEISDILTFSGTLVDSIEKSIDDKVIVAKILEIKSHPNADRLKIAIVDTGSEKLQIVCGASNIAEGQIVPLAMIGAKLGDFEIKEAEIRGIKSYGMMCSEKELGLSENHEGIKILPDNYTIGHPLNKYLNGETVLDIEITPNRGDCLSHLGIARELSSVALKSPLNFKPALTEITAKEPMLNIEISAPKECFQYSGMIITGVKIAPSPTWLQTRLKSLGINPINNVVDITNYIMLDLGQPLHAFDRSKLADDSIIVRVAKDNETIVSIDGETRTLNPDVLVIADKNGPIAIAGVMGGYDSEIDDHTDEIILESAEFERKSIRKTAKTLGMTTEASYRFERGIDPSIVKVALDKAANLIVEICGGKIVDCKYVIANDYKNTWIPIEYDRINQLLGTSLSKDDIQKYLSALSFNLKDDMCQAPTWRHDVEIWQDLAEEVARIYGLDKIKPVPDTKSKQSRFSDYYYKEFIKDLLVDEGFSEIYTYPFLSETDLAEAKIDTKDLLEVANPIQSQNKYMRKSLIPGLLKCVAKNPAFDPIAIFEVGNVFDIENERSATAFATSGKNAKKIIDRATAKLKEATGISDDTILIRELSREELTRFKIKKPITCIVEIKTSLLIDALKNKDIEPEFMITTKKVHYRPISKFPSLTRDLAFIVDTKVSSDEIIDVMYDQSELINRIELFDEFSSDKFGKDKKNVAFHLDLQHLDRTLMDKEADEVVAQIVKIIEDKFKAKLRNY